MKTTKKIARVAILVMAVMMVLSFTSCNKKGKNPLKDINISIRRKVLNGGKVTLFIF